MPGLKFFISYSTANDKLAGEIKRYLEDFGQEAFLAHDDIQSGSQWEEEILKSLETTDIFLTLETANLQTSRWCHQEIGIALARKLIILPLIVVGAEEKPTGFHGKYQGFRIRLDDLRESVRHLLIQQGIIQDIADTVEEKRLLALERSDSWAQAGENATRIVEVENQLSDKQKIRVAKIVLSNSEVSNSFAAMNTLKPYFSRWADIIPRELLDKIL